LRGANPSPVAGDGDMDRRMSDRTDTDAPDDDPHCDAHPDRGAAGRCVGCERLVCPDCRVTVDGRVYCKACIAAGAAGLPVDDVETRNRLPAAALVLSCAWVVPGLGLLAAIGGLILGHAARSRLEESGRSDPVAERTCRLAIIVGAAGIGLAVVVLVMAAAVVAGLITWL